MPYQRVIPRDLFNEAKLLKCLGQLSLLIHDGKAGALVMDHDKPERGFVIDQDPSCGAIYCTNLRVSLKGRRIRVKSSLNSRDAYPLVFEYDENKTEGEVFNNDGTLATEFTDWLATL
jgi:hypothetical protein